mmetsp:Transcript_17764/g.15683  ORF Transcript_17764/g.15683 Transcript_17764/m.15683 type:complete len:132 (+) Transcript_17764:624-1019(+)
MLSMNMRINKRDDFVNKNGLYIPKDLLPQLGDKASLLKMVDKAQDQREEKMLQDADRYINGIDSNVYYFEKVFQDITKNIIKDNGRSMEVNKLKNEARVVRDQHEKEIIKLLNPYKDEIQNLVDKIQELEA